MPSLQNSNLDFPGTSSIYNYGCKSSIVLNVFRSEVRRFTHALEAPFGSSGSPLFGLRSAFPQLGKRLAGQPERGPFAHRLSFETPVKLKS